MVVPSADNATVQASTGPASMAHNSVSLSRSQTLMCESRDEDTAIPCPSRVPFAVLTEVMPRTWPRNSLFLSIRLSLVTVKERTISSHEPVTRPPRHQLQLQSPSSAASGSEATLENIVNRAPPGRRRRDVRYMPLYCVPSTSLRSLTIGVLLRYAPNALRAQLRA